MPKAAVLASFCLSFLFAFLSAWPSRAEDVVTVETGKLRGALNADKTVRMFKGVPFAAPPVGELRWKPPQPAIAWTGIRAAHKFGPACLQTDVFGDIYFRDAQPSEDCLNLNIWIPANAESNNLPVLVWYYGGGFVAGGNSEVRYDGENLAKRGVIVVEPNYRLGVFGFFSYPELAKESEHAASGNYGLLDQVAALRWVIRNIAAFGGDAHNITIGGESAGSLSVSALMASPLSRNLFQKALGESGAFFPLGPTEGMQLKALSETTPANVKFAESLGAKSLAELRAKPGEELLQAAAKLNRGFAFRPNIDGYFLPTDVATIFAKGEQSKVPLLAGWNADEGKLNVLLNPKKTTAESFKDTAHARFGDAAAEFLKLYPASTDEEAIRSAEDLAGDDFIAFSTWKWLDMQLKTGNAPVYQYLFAQVPKTKPGAMIGPLPASEAGSKHAGEIEYVFETLKSQVGVTWADDDFKVSALVASYWANFIKNGNPNGADLPKWPALTKRDGYPVMRLFDSDSRAAADARRSRYEFLDTHSVAPR
jgi:para-nitrobenzyl esterase